MPTGIDRRTFLQLGSLAAAGLLTPAASALQVADVSITRRGPAKKIIIAGAGMSGLVAAYELSNAGHDVTLVEAQRRPGGRVFTMREAFSDGLYAEVGAGRIPSTHAITLKYVKMFDLPLVPFYPDRLADVFYAGGKRIKTVRGQKVDMSQVPLELTEEERRLGFDGMEEKYLSAAMKEVGDFSDPRWPPPQLDKYDRISFSEFLRQRGASPAAIAHIALGFEDDSALDWLRDGASHAAPRLFKIRGGNDQLPRAFAARLSRKILYGCPVVRIEQTNRSVRVSVRRAGKLEMIEGDYLICCIPFSVLRAVEIAPAFSPGKMNAIHKLTYGSVARVFLQMRRKYWLDDGCNGFALADQPLEIWNATWDSPGDRGILVSYMYEALARQVTAMSTDDRVEFMLDFVDKVHPGARRNFEGGTNYSWDEDPWHKGAYTLFLPGDYSSLQPHVSTPEGRVHFAGEHASMWPGWIQGALTSGLRAARAVNEAPDV